MMYLFSVSRIRVCLFSLGCNSAGVVFQCWYR
uniref:Uncharacterized protein n=1 Tax=Rhizophora mucronata TaxID=61149 RepID=A0A2P2NRC9_RHIMU